MGTMGYLNLSSSIRYGPHGKRRKTKAFTKKSKKQKYQEMILQQQKVFDGVVVGSDLIKEIEKGIENRVNIFNNVISLVKKYSKAIK